MVDKNSVADRKVVVVFDQQGRIAEGNDVGCQRMRLDNEVKHRAGRVGRITGVNAPLSYSTSPPPLPAPIVWDYIYVFRTSKGILLSKYGVQQGTISLYEEKYENKE